jgi:hypothetical protein
MKLWYDKDARNRVFKPGDKVLVFLPIPGHPLQARYYGPYEIESKLSDVNYVVKTPGQRKEIRICHINTLKEYFDRCHQTSVKSVYSLAYVETLENCTKTEISVESSENDFNHSVRLNSDIFANMDDKLGHLDPHQKEQIQQLMASYPSIFMDVFRKTNAVSHDFIMGYAVPIKQHPCRLNPLKLQYCDQRCNTC